MATTSEGLQFSADAEGQRSTTRVNKAVYAAALAGVRPEAAAAVAEERAWRKRYPKHVWALTEAGVLQPEYALRIAQDGLAAAWAQCEFVRGAQALGLAEAMQQPLGGQIAQIELRGQGAPTIEPWSLPYRGKQLRGAELREQLERWEDAGVIEPSHGQALRRLMEHPEWFDLADRTVVLLGAGSEAGPLAALAHWRANIIAIDLPDAARWQRITSIVRAGNGRLIAPLSQPVAADTPVEQWVALAGANLLTQTPELAAWLLGFEQDLDLAALAYLDGAQHLRVSLAMDAILATVSEARPATTLMYMATPADVFAVPEATARAAMAQAQQLKPMQRLGTALVRALSGGRLLQPHIRTLLTAQNGKRYGIVDGIVLQQGPNYALAKRLQQWRALLARAQGQRVAINVTPSTLTQSVIKNPALKAGYDGAKRFGIEIFEPATTSALMAALWVHDLRCNECAANPAVVLDNPLELLMEGANHGGLWRNAFLPRTALPIAALMGYLRIG
ncbi:hypothetical protein [Candidatus Viridilinea mediisalina]|uniref:Uncharacterized protein n=1 Tax=Candidatus Viridilinea mediisalina TaxID=2024553 RepID=A0A2A6RDW2_9CHLR|nr:hypothetical protein [Candidatus Viridilinea mediisalina]PDW00394.1 hypothetical protein CJ255_20745 [Candidatus Viridilinea mediisalina]